MSANESIDILKQKMEPRGFSFELIQLGMPARSYTRIHSPGGNTIIVSSSSPLYPFATSSARTIYRDKRRLYDLAQLLGLQIPATLTIQAGDFLQRYDELKQFLDHHGTVIVKPDSGSGSKGLSLDITTIAQLENAVQTAREVSQGILIQRQFYGEEIRFAVIGGKVRAALLRQKAVVIGNGHATLHQLVEQENQARAGVIDTMVPYPQLDESFIDKTGLGEDDIVPLGERVELNKGTMIRTGASIYDVTGQVHSDYISIVEQLASQFGPGFLAVDLMLEDYTLESEIGNHVILEVNTNPALSLFYSCRDGKHVPIVEDYLADALLYAMDGWKA